LAVHAGRHDVNVPSRFTSAALFIDDVSGTVVNGCLIHPFADCRGTDLTGADLSGADLSHAYLPGANLTDANLTDANLTDTNLTDANLTDANLTDAIGLNARHRGVLCERCDRAGREVGAGVGAGFLHSHYIPNPRKHPQKIVFP
jgi:uncharacterized protein YjbI with pentapeptide repeats